MKKLIKLFLPASALLLPVVTSAQLGGLGDLLAEVEVLIGYTFPVMVGLALLAFFWGLVKFIFAQSSESAKTDAKKVMFWGLIALFVMISVWGIVSFLQGAFLEGADFGPPTVPTI